MLTWKRLVVSRGALAALAAGAIVAAGVAANAPASSTAVPAVKVVLEEWTLTPSVATLRARSVSFLVRNAGGIPHEFVVVRTTRHHHALPMRGGKAVETGEVGEIDELKPGETKRLTLRLGPGKYVLLCNLPGHYKAGQYAAFRVL